MFYIMQELQRFIEKGESKTIEFKGFLSLKNEIGETVSAFSNTNKARLTNYKLYPEVSGSIRKME